MSTSFVSYRGHGFWSFDPYLEDFLALLAEAVKGTREEWLAEAREHWLTQATGDFASWIHPKFDEYIKNDERREVVLSILTTIISRRDIAAEAKQTAVLFRSLLKGELMTNESSPLDYMIQGPQPYERRAK